MFIQPTFSTVVEHDLKNPIDDKDNELPGDLILVDPPWNKFSTDEIMNEGLIRLQNQGILMI